jgi:ribosome-binding factor A
MKGHRQRRLADFIQEEVSQIIREELSDPELQGMITISRVELSPDLKRAKVYYQVHGGREAEEAVARGFARAGSYIRHLLAQRLYTKFVPEITFAPDRADEAEERLEALFARIRGEDESS